MGKLHSKLLPYITVLASISLLLGCKSAEKVIESRGISPQEEVEYSIIYLIHGDADYLYHDSLGRSRQADEEVLAEAKRLGQKASRGEVFIFHQRPEKKILWLFPQKDRRFYHYRNGILENSISYSPSSESGIFSTESRLLNEHKTGTEGNINNIFLYFGHEIPYSNGLGYHRTIPGIDFNTDNFAKGLRKMLPEGEIPFELTVLSTCNNGSPDMVHAMKPYSQTLLASPQNLHLSHIDTGKLSVLDQHPDMEGEKLASVLANDTYARLSNFIQTVISLTVYDMQQVSKYISETDSLYRQYLNNSPAQETVTENTDCTSLPVFGKDSDLTKGVTVWYRPPKFGHKTNKKTHSGWGCKSLGKQSDSMD